RDLEDLPAGEDRARGRRGAGGVRGRFPGPEPPDGRGRVGDLSVQGVRLDRAAVVSLAVYLLSESRAAADRRLDARDLPAMGRGSWGDDLHAGELVSGAERAEADDRSPGVRGWRKSGSHVD